MNICEAILAIDSKHPYITRKSWNKGIVHHKPMVFAIQPTDGPDCCIVYGVAKPLPRWQPARADLTADDWVTVDAYL